MTQNSKFYGRAKEYVDYKNSLAQELKLHLLGNVRGGVIEVKDKWNKQDCPTTRILALEASFYRDDQRRVDLDNLLKMAMDLLQTAGLIYNDDQIREIHAYLCKGIVKGSFNLNLKFLPQ